MTFTIPIDNSRPLRILIATEYLPPYISGIANRCKNLISGYKRNNHHVTVYSLKGTDADHVVFSVPNVFYNAQRMFIFPPLMLIVQLLNPFKKVNYDIVHLFGPLCLPFVFLLPLFYLRGVKIYVSYHVFLRYYRDLYFTKWNEKYYGMNLLGDILEYLYVALYFLPFVFWADIVGVPSKTADWCVAKNIHYMKSGLDSEIFKPIVVSDEMSYSQDDKKVLAKKSETKCDLFNEVVTKAKYSGPLLCYVGRLALEKNIIFLLRALLNPALSNASIILIGDGPERSILEKASMELVGSENVFCNSEKLNLSPKEILRISRNKRIVFVGMVYNENDVATYYSSCDVFVSASASETFGFTVAEALACGAPSVVVRSGAFASVYSMIDDWMYVENDTQDYVNKIVKCLNLGVAARKKSRNFAVEYFSIDAAIFEQLRAYKEVVFCKNEFGQKVMKFSSVNTEETLQESVSLIEE
ncbi:Sulfoquinovosyl transferase sqd2 [Lobulomyces angularis]|nr:Sulfoquinovosyl transferase sqd2 [Lobulomyces angularis]